MLQIFPLLAGLRENHPKDTIHALVGDPYLCLFEENPLVDRVFPFPLKKVHKNQKTAAELEAAKIAIKDLLPRLTENRYDLVINRQFSGFEMGLAGSLDAESVLGPYLLNEGKPEQKQRRLGTLLENDGAIEQEQLLIDPRTADHIWNIVHNRKNYRKNLVDVGLELAGFYSPPGPHYRVTTRHRKKAVQMLSYLGIRETKPLLGVQMGASHGFRCLSSGVMAEALNLWQEEADGQILFFGTTEEQDRIRSVMEQLKNPEFSFSLAGKTSLPELAACLERMDLLLCSDTGTMHLAAAVQTPTASLFFGSAFPWQTGAYGSNHLTLFADLPCAPCKNTAECSMNGRCKALFTPASVKHFLDLAFHLQSKDGNETTEILVHDWNQRCGRDPVGEQLRVYHTGSESAQGPQCLMEIPVVDQESKPAMATV